MLWDGTIKLNRYFKGRKELDKHYKWGMSWVVKWKIKNRVVILEYAINHIEIY